MYSVRVDMNDTVYDKVMFFLNNISKADIKIKELKNDDNTNDDSSLVEFFRNSPLVGEIELKRDTQTYLNRVEF